MKKVTSSCGADMWLASSSLGMRGFRGDLHAATG